MRTSLLPPALLFFFTLPLAACASATTRTTGLATEDAPTDPVDGGAHADAAARAKPSTPKGFCEALIACVADVEPTAAGGLVTLYGDASNCWKGSAADAEACGKACEKTLDQRKECMAEPLARHYLAMCTSNLSSSERALYDVDLVFHPRTGGTMTLRPLPATARTYRAADALATSPPLKLTIERGGGAGETTTPWDVPFAAFGDGNPGSLRVVKLGVKRLRTEGSALCSDLEGEIDRPWSTSLDGACLYLPLDDGAAIPSRTRSQIQTCDPGPLGASP